jgi:hypothetical protein
MIIFSFVNNFESDCALQLQFFLVFFQNEAHLAYRFGFMEGGQVILRKKITLKTHHRIVHSVFYCIFIAY